MGSFSITQQGYRRFADFLQSHSGILLSDNKQYLVQSRLGKIMQELHMQCLEDLVDRLSSSMDRGLKQRVIDAMTTNETLWFRDTYPYEILTKRLLPEFQQQGLRRLKVWSSACSTGQEPYSIAMTVKESAELQRQASAVSLDILATDISPTALESARTGEYEMLALGRGLEKSRLEKHFSQMPSGNWQIDAALKRSIHFRHLNLLDSYTALGTFDVIFCRNVLIYFSAEMKLDILTRMHARLRKGGYLFLGASESMTELRDKFQMIHCRPGIVYQSI